MHRFALSYLFCTFSLCFYAEGITAYAQHKSPLNDLFLPGHKVHAIPHSRHNTWVMLSEKPFEQHVKYYLNLCKPSHGKSAVWKLTSPSLPAAQAWLAALRQTPAKETANFMLNLHHTQTGVNVSLTIGELKTTSAPQFRSIITLYASHERKGGK